MSTETDRLRAIADLIDRLSPALDGRTTIGPHGTSVHLIQGPDSAGVTGWRQALATIHAELGPATGLSVPGRFQSLRFDGGPLIGELRVFVTCWEGRAPDRPSVDATEYLAEGVQA